MQISMTNPYPFHASIPVKTPKFLAVVATVQHLIINTPTAFLRAMDSDSGCRRADADAHSGLASIPRPSLRDTLFQVRQPTVRAGSGCLRSSPHDHIQLLNQHYGQRPGNQGYPVSQLPLYTGLKILFSNQVSLPSNSCAACLIVSSVR